jgi:hypothetical protein
MLMLHQWCRLCITLSLHSGPSNAVGVSQGEFRMCQHATTDLSLTKKTKQRCTSIWCHRGLAKLSGGTTTEVG